MSAFTKSPWVFHYDGASCNGCDIEVVACLMPTYDLERLGVVNTGNPKHADILLITGGINAKGVEIVKNLYQQMPEPRVVVAVGACACTGGIFAKAYNILGGVDQVIPVDAFVPGCAAHPHSIMEGVLKAVEILQHKQQQRLERGDKPKGST